MKLFNVRSKFLLLCITAVFVTACQTVTDEIIEDSTVIVGVDQLENEGFGVSSGNTGLDLTALEGGSNSSVIAIDDEVESAQAVLDNVNSDIDTRVIYFQFDSEKISEDSLRTLEAHGDFISTNANVFLRLEGHSDERGSREYNIALGDRRAQSVRRVLLFQGASVDQLETVSYGEEQPAVSTHTEDSWSKNRRVDLVYQVN